MPFDRPPPQDILQRIQAEIDIALPGADARVRRSVEGVMARVLAMSMHELYGYLGWASRQILPDSAEAEFLERHASLWGVFRKSAAAASGAVTFTGTDGAIVPAGSLLTRSDDSAYITLSDIAIAGGSGTGSVVATLAGAESNAVSGTRLRLSAPVAGVASEAPVQAGGLSGGADAEDDAALRARVIERIRQPPHGGAAFDYIVWALEVPGVTRAWVWPEQYGPGTLAISFVMDEKVGTILPSAGEVAAVQAYIDARRPVTADPTVIAPTALPVDFIVHLNPNSLSVQTAVRAEIEDFFRREAKPGGTLFVSRMREAISAAVGEFDHILVAPAGNVVAGFGQMPVPGTYTFAGI